MFVLHGPRRLAGRQTQEVVPEEEGRGSLMGEKRPAYICHCVVCEPPHGDGSYPEPLPTGIKEVRVQTQSGEYINAITAAGGRAEVRVVDPNTGGEKGSKLARWDLMPFDVLNELAEHFGIGARKYEDRNWERGYDWGLSLAALCRHLSAWAGGEDTDPESGDSHLIAVMWHAAALRAFQIRGLGTDTRSKA